MNRLLILLLIVSSLLHAEVETPILKYPESMTWKGIFDAGFRPKLAGGNLSRTSSDLREQIYILQFKDNRPFPIEKGYMTFRLRSDESLGMIAHAGRKPLTISEAQEKLDLFHEVFAGYLFRKGTLPPIMERGLVKRSTELNAIAETDDHSFNLGINGSGVPEKPYLMSFMISTRVFADKPRLPIRREIVKPPEGYEWFDMTPVSNIPPERQKRIDEILRLQKSNQQEAEQKPPIVREPKPLSDTESKADKPVSFPWWLLRIVGLILVLGFIILKGKSK